MSGRISVNKTNKLFIGGAFPRSESGRVQPFYNKKGEAIANYCRASKKDFRNAVVAANKGYSSWQKASAYLRGQIVYRIAEMMESRMASFQECLQLEGRSGGQSKKEMELITDMVVSYAGWSDKYQQLYSTINPVASSHYNFSSPEPVGTIALLLSPASGLREVLDGICRLIVGGNSVVVVGCEFCPLSVTMLSEVIATSDVPGGVVNILTGEMDELFPVIADHEDVEGILTFGGSNEAVGEIQARAASNLKTLDFLEKSEAEADPYGIMAFQEIKTTWHPIGN